MLVFKEVDKLINLKPEQSKLEILITLFMIFKEIKMFLQLKQLNKDKIKKKLYKEYKLNHQQNLIKFNNKLMQIKKH